jgi:exodeoxyribonuclease-3
MASANLATVAASAVVERAATYAERWSDHAPVTCVYDWEVTASVPAQRHPAEAELLSDAADHQPG